jgi:hypothetical protein
MGSCLPASSFASRRYMEDSSLPHSDLIRLVPGTTEAYYHRSSMLRLRLLVTIRRQTADRRSTGRQEASGPWGGSNSRFNFNPFVLKMNSPGEYKFVRASYVLVIRIQEKPLKIRIGGGNESTLDGFRCSSHPLVFFSSHCRWTFPWVQGTLKSICRCHVCLVSTARIRETAVAGVHICTRLQVATQHVSRFPFRGWCSMKQ